MVVKEYDLKSGKVLPFRSVSELGEKAVALVNQLTPEEYKSHPEFGLIPPTQACENCVELIHERRADMRVFVHVDQPTLKTYETVYGYLHYEDESGQLRTLSDEITFRSGDWVCTGASPFQRCFNLKTGEIKVNLLEQGFLRFGHERLYFVNNNEEITYEESPQINGPTFGVDGTFHPFYFSFLDREAIVNPGGVKTNYVLPASPSLFTDEMAYLVLEDTLFLPQGFQATYDEGTQRIYIQNPAGEYLYAFHPPILYSRATFDKSLELHSLFSHISYELQKVASSVFLYRIRIPKSLLSSLPYPIVIDPLSTFYSPFYGAEMFFRYTTQGAQCWRPLANYCGYSVTVNVPNPQGGTIVSVRFQAQYITSCPSLWCCYYMNDVAFKISGPCGVSPSDNNFYWFCNSSAPGTCTADGSATYNIYTETTNCIAPACSYSLTYEIRNYNCYNACLTGGCGGNRTDFPYAYHPANTYRIILDLRTVENNPTAEGQTGTVNVTCANLPVDLCANPSYGVPSYTTTWYANGSPIGTGNCITHNPPPSSTITYTAVTQDACGTTITNTVRVNNTCTLPIEFVDVKVVRGEQGLVIKWLIGGKEEGDPTHFVIERRFDQTS
jgi:hypothetical protein